MPDGSQISQEIRLQLDRIELFEPVEAIDQFGRSALGEVVSRGHAGVDRLRAALDTLYEIAVQSDSSAPQLVEVAGIIRDKERADAELHLPGIVSLERKLATKPLRDAEATKLLRELADTARSRLALYRDHRDKLLKLAADRRAAAGEIPRARPVKGEVDHEALSREFMARYPKLRAALAK